MSLSPPIVRRPGLLPLVLHLFFRLRSALLLGLLALATCAGLTGVAQAGTYFAEVPGHPELIIDTATNSPSKGNIWMRCAIGQTWDPNAVPARFPTAKGDCVGTPTKMSWSATTAAVNNVKTANFGGYNTWIVPTGSSLSGLFPPEVRQDAHDAWPCSQQSLATDPCYGNAITENDMFRSTPTDEVFWSSTNVVIARLVGNFKTGKLDSRSFSSGNGYLRLMVPAPGQLLDVTVSTDANGKVDTPSRSQMTTGQVVFQLTPNPAYEVDQVRKTSGDCIMTRLGNTISAIVGTTHCAISATFKRIPGVWLITNLNAINAPFAPSGKLVCQKAIVNTGESTQCDYSYSNPGYQVTGFTGCDRWATTATGASCFLDNISADRTVEATALPITSFSGTTVPTAGTWGVAGTATASITGARMSWPHCRFDPANSRFEAAPAAPANQWMPQGQFHFELLDCDTYQDPVVVTISWPQPLTDMVSTDNGFGSLAPLTVVDAHTLQYSILPAATWPGNAVTLKQTVGPVAPAQYAITVTAGTGGSASCTPNPVDHGGKVQCTATPNAGYMFVAWGGDCSGATASCTLDPVSAAQTVTAQFGAVQTSFSGTTVPGAGTPAGTATASFTGGGATCRFDTANTAFVGAPPTLPAGQLMPHGMFKFKLIGCDSTPVAMAITWPDAVQGLTKWGKDSASATAPSHFTPTGKTVTGNTTHFSVQDGQLGDDDWTVNGDIVDPVGATVGVVVMQVPSLQTWALLLLGLLTALAGTAMQRRRV